MNTLKGYKLTQDHVTLDDCVPWAHARNSAGYGAVRIGGRTVLAHRVAYEKTHGPIPDGMCVCHRCDNPPCVNIGHLFLGTHSDNAKDMVGKGRWRGPVGEQHRCARLSEKTVQEIRARYSAWNRKCSLRKLAVEFGVDHKTIFRVVSGRGWRTA